MSNPVDYIATVGIKTSRLMNKNSNRKTRLIKPKLEKRLKIDNHNLSQIIKSKLSPVQKLYYASSNGIRLTKKCSTSDKSMSQTNTINFNNLYRSKPFSWNAPKFFESRGSETAELFLRSISNNEDEIKHLEENSPRITSMRSEISTTGGPSTETPYRCTYEENKSPMLTGIPQRKPEKFFRPIVTSPQGKDFTIVEFY